MKRLIPLIFLTLLLWGCAPREEIPTPSETAPADPVSAAEPTGFYAPGSDLEADTQGALRIYPLNRNDSYGLVPMGSDFLLFSGDAYTTLTKLSGDNLYIAATAQLPCAIYPKDAAVQVSEKGITYYDELSNVLVFLDTGLNEVNRVRLPDDLTGHPALSADRKTLYYCTTDAIRVFDLESGLHKLLKEISYSQQTLDSIHCDGTVLQCSVRDGSSDLVSFYISTETGETLYETSDDITLTTFGNLYLTIRMNGAYPEMLWGSADTEFILLRCDTVNTLASPVLAVGGTVLSSYDEDTGCTTLDYYDLESGKRTSSVQLPGNSTPCHVHGDAQNRIWFLRYDTQFEGMSIYCWDLAGTPTGDERVYTGIPYTADNPDAEGLSTCETLAQEIGQKHNVEILTWTAATQYQPDGYTLEPEYQVPAIHSCLEALDTALSRYPADFLKKTVSGTDRGILQICLVRAVTKSSGNRIIPGVQYWDRDGNACLAIAVEADLEQPFHHLLFHVIESRVMSSSSAYDDWDDLNPDGFSYTYSDVQTGRTENDVLLTGSDQAFIDGHAMTYPREDRARIMEHAMMTGSEDLFAAPILQQKLRLLCQGIREAYELERSEEIFPWELYLSEPLISRG